MTWKQFDILVVLIQDEVATTREISDQLEKIVKYDKRHGGTFYTSFEPHSTHSSLRTLEGRRLVRSHHSRGGVSWAVTDRGRQAIDALVDVALFVP